MTIGLQVCSLIQTSPRLLLTFFFFLPDQVINAILPVELLQESPSAFSQVGHIGNSILSLSF